MFIQNIIKASGSIPNNFIFIWFFGAKIPDKCLMNIALTCSQLKEIPDARIYFYTNDINKLQQTFVVHRPELNKYVEKGKLIILSTDELIEYFERWYVPWFNYFKATHSSFNQHTPEKIYHQLFILLQHVLPEYIKLDKVLKNIVLLESVGASNIAYLSDFLRLIALLKHGGVYLDMDVILEKFTGKHNTTFSGLLLARYGDQADTANPKWNNCVIAATPNNVYIALMLFDILFMYLIFSERVTKILKEEFVRSCREALLKMIRSVSATTEFTKKNGKWENLMGAYKKDPFYKDWHGLRRTSQDYRKLLTVFSGGVIGVVRLGEHFAVENRHESRAWVAYAFYPVQVPDENFNRHPKKFKLYSARADIQISLKFMYSWRLTPPRSYSR